MTDLELRIPPPVIALACLIDMWLLAWLIPVGHYQLARQELLVAVPLLLGLLLPLAGWWQFYQAHTTIDPRNPSASRNLVTGGIYRLTRNPMYLGFALLLVAWGNWLEHLWAWLMLPVYVGYLTRYQIKPEERLLRDKFGATYDAYCQRVRRWL